MNSKLVRYQLVAFIIVTVLGMGYAMASYVGLGPIFGIGQYNVSVNLPTAGGLYPNAAVTERGTTVGKVDGIHLSPGDHGVVADISLHNGTRIPSDLRAAVANTSAVGEQYLELTPNTTSGPYLASGSVIPASEVSLPPNPSTTLANLNTLLKSVPTQQLNTTVNEMYNAFNGTGPDMARLLDSSQQLLTTARQNLSPTKQLIGQSQTVLGTQAANSANITNFSRNLNLFTTQLRNSNGDLAGTLQHAPGAVNQANALIGQLQPTVPLLLSNLTSVGQVAKVYLPAIQQALVILPADVNDLTASIMTSSVPGTSNVNFRMQGNSPCTTGYPTTMRQPTDTAAKAGPGSVPYCTAPHSSPQQVRGAHNYPCPNNPSLRAASAAGCGLFFGTRGTPAAPAAPGGSAGSGSGGTGAASYDPANGLLVGPNGLLYSVGPGTVSGNGPTTLSGLLQQTLGS